MLKFRKLSESLANGHKRFTDLPNAGLCQRFLAGCKFQIPDLEGIDAHDAAAGGVYGSDIAAGDERPHSISR